MKLITLCALLSLISCAHEPSLVSRPSWVAAIRSGEESLKVNHGNKVFYRRLAGTKAMSQQVACDLAVIRVEEDIRKEFPLLSSVPYAVEVLVYDPEYGECAITASVSSSVPNRYAELTQLANEDAQRKRAIASKETVSEDEATELLQYRSQTATRYALTGMTKEEFEKFAQDKVYMNIGGSACETAFKTDAYSIHGSTHICWRGENILGYCTTKDSQCWTKVP